MIFAPERGINSILFKFGSEIDIVYIQQEAEQKIRS